MNRIQMVSQEYNVLLFYRFLPFGDLELLKQQLKDVLSKFDIRGRILIAPEGINGTLASWGDCYKDIIQALEEFDSRFKQIDWKTSRGEGIELPFKDLFIRPTKELIGTSLLGKGIFDHNQYSEKTYGGLDETTIGIHLKPHEFHNKLSQLIHNTTDNQSSASETVTSANSDGTNKDHNDGTNKDHNDGTNYTFTDNTNKLNKDKEKILLLDIRNDIEYQVGHFLSAINIKTNYYSESWKNIDLILAQHQNEIQQENTSIMMYCTGGIRCEKASAYLIQKGIHREKIYQLEGGIHKYLEQYPGGGYFEGKNYVFDSRLITSPSQYISTNGSTTTTTSTTASTEANNSNTNDGKGSGCGNDKSNSLVADTHHTKKLCTEQPLSHTNDSTTTSTITTSNGNSTSTSSGSSGSSRGNIAGHCSYCHHAYDIVCWDRICCVCRLEVLICDSCVQNNRHPGQYHCELHKYLKDCYFKNLSPYTLEELNLQIITLQTLEKQLIGHSEKNKRRTLRNQVERIKQRINEIQNIHVSQSEEVIDSSILC